MRIRSQLTTRKNEQERSSHLPTDNKVDDWVHYTSSIHEVQQDHVRPMAEIKLEFALWLRHEVWLDDHHG